MLQESVGKPDLALKSFQEALQLQREIGDKRGLGKTLINLGVFYVESRGQYEEALQSYKEALQIERDVSNENLQAFCLNGIGNVYLARGEYEDALTYFERALQLREKFKVPGDVADTLHNLAETSTNLGKYDQALTYYLRALELRRSADDKVTAAIESYSIGTVFGYQGRYGAAVKSKDEALKGYRAAQERGFWLAEILGGYGSSLSQAGRTAEAEPNLKEALELAGELHNQVLIAQTLNFQGEDAWYRGDVVAARSLFDRAVKEASRTTDRRLQLLTNLNVARTALSGADKGKGLQTIVGTLRGLVQQSDVLGLRYLTIESSIVLGEALLKAGPARGGPAGTRARDRAGRETRHSGTPGPEPLSDGAGAPPGWQRAGGRPPHHRSANVAGCDSERGGHQRPLDAGRPGISCPGWAYKQRNLRCRWRRASSSAEDHAGRCRSTTSICNCGSVAGMYVVGRPSSPRTMLQPCAMALAL